MPTHPAQTTQRIVPYLYPYLYVVDVAAYLAFLAKAFGFETRRHEVASVEASPASSSRCP